MLQDWLDECAITLERLKRKVEQGEASGGEINAMIARLERVFADDEAEEDGELGDPWEGEKIDPNRGYMTGDPVADRWEREFARTGRPPEDF